ncbi:MAG: hypothetical protein MUO50_14360 [Longimicrobiales bacterium]|nr:hypothetical protein [Longimicrobiales bacterium]
MGLKDHLQRSITMTVLQRSCMIVVTLLSTLLLLTIWPRFRNDALSLDWYVYLILVILFSAPLLKRG